MKIRSIGKISTLMCSFFFFSSLLTAQHSVGSWTPYPAYQNAELVAETTNKVFAVYDGSLLSYSPEDEEVRFYSKADGLNDTDIAYLVFNNETKSLVIVYRNSNIDIFTNDGIYNLPFIKDNIYLQDKEIFNLEIIGTEAYLSAAFGIVVVDLKRKEIKDTYPLSSKCKSVCIFGDYIYVATVNGFRRGLLSANLKDEQNWERYDPNPYEGREEGRAEKFFVFKDRLCFYQNSSEGWGKINGVFYMDAARNVTLLTGGPFNRVTLLNDQLVLVKESSVAFYSDLNNKVEWNNVGGNDISHLNNKDIYWLARGTSGLTGVQKGTGSEHTFVLQGLTKNSPKRNYAYRMSFAHNKLFVVGGAGDADIDRADRPGTLMILEKGEWFNLDEEALGKQVELTCRDFVNIAVDPRDPNRYFVSSWGDGVYEFKDNKFDMLHSMNNSTLGSSVAGNRTFVRTNGMGFDPDNNLYVANATNNVSLNGLHRYSADKTWEAYYLSELSSNGNLGNLFVTRKGIIWITVPRGATRVFALDPATGHSGYATTINIGDKNATAFFCAIEDLDGTIWIGTDNGPYTYPGSKAVSEISSTSFSRPKIPKNDGTDLADYLLAEQKITTIAVDGANRKWIGTEGSGVFLVSASGDAVLENFTEENSLLISNDINSIVINQESGEVFIGTDKGLISYMGDAITGKPDYSNVYAFPNPVRPDMDNKVIVTGLIKDSNVRVTDLAGNVVAYGISAGGQFTWDCRNRRGQIVAPGIYLVFASVSASDKTEGVVTKIMVVQ